MPYSQAMYSPGVIAGGMPTILTISGLSQHMIELFWPMIATSAGFANPDHPPTYLTLETAQYFMSHLVRPLLDQGLFSSVTMQRNRIYSQVIDNLNKAAVVGFSYKQIYDRLKSSWSGEPVQVKVYEVAQHCAILFREYCLAHNLLDFSRMEVLQLFEQVNSDGLTIIMVTHSPEIARRARRIVSLSDGELVSAG